MNAKGASSSSHITHIVTAIEQRLADFYRLELAHRAQDFLLNHKPEASGGRANVYVQELDSADPSLDIGIYLSPHLQQSLVQSAPLSTLDLATLDSFTTVVEEVSHFILITQRAVQYQSVTPLELEMQGEMDKFLISAQLLKEQTGDPHLLPLARMLFDCATYTSPDPIYPLANKIAARFWFSIAHTHAQSGPFPDSDLRDQLCTFFRATLADKPNALSDLVAA